MKQRILVVDDDADTRRAEADILEAGGYDVTVAGDADEAMQAVQSAPPDLLLVDVGLKGSNGIDLARALAGRRIATVMITGLASFDVGHGYDDIEAIRAFLYKPCGAAHLLETIRGILRVEH